MEAHARNAQSEESVIRSGRRGLVRKTVSMHRPVLCMMLVYLCAWAMGCVGLRSQATESSLVCGGVEIVAASDSFQHSFDIEYRVTSSQPYCVMDGWIGGPEVPTSPVELWPAGAAPVPELEVPVRFAHAQKVSFNRDPSVLSLETSAADVPVGGPRLDVPPGNYRLFLRYQTGKCDGSMGRRTCLESSEVFEIRESMEFAIEN